MPIPLRGVLRWLGVQYDHRLTINHHVFTQTATAQRVVNSLHLLGGVARGAPPTLMRRALIACVLPILTLLTHGRPP